MPFDYIQHPKKSVKLTFLHKLKHFEIHLDAAGADLPSICPEIRDMLLDAVDSAADAFRFKNSRASVAFQCPCGLGDVHTATPNEAHSKLICSRTGDISRGGLTASQGVWLGPRITSPGNDIVCVDMDVWLEVVPLFVDPATSQSASGSGRTSERGERDTTQNGGQLLSVSSTLIFHSYGSS